MKRFDSTTYAKVPLYIAQLPMSSWAIRAYIILKRYFNTATRSAFPSKQTVASYFPGAHLRSVHRGIKELESLGIIEVTRRTEDDNGATRTNLYRFSTDEACKKIFDEVERDRSARGGDKSTIPPMTKSPSPYKAVELTGTERKHRRTTAAASGRAPTRLHNPEPKSQNREAAEVLQWIAREYERIKGEPMRIAPRQMMIVKGVISTFGAAGARALWRLWWTQGPWATFATSSGHSVEAWDRCIDRLVDAEDYRNLVKQFSKPEEVKNP